MIYLYAGAAVILIAVGAFFTFYRGRSKDDEFQMPVLKNNFRNRAALTEAFMMWIKQADAASGAWLLNLEPKERDAFVKAADRFCKKGGFQLAWIVEDQIEDETLRLHMAQSVQRFVQAHRSESEAKGDLVVYKALIDLLKNAGRGKYRPKTQAVYLQLAKQDVIPQANVDILFQRDRRRWEQAAKAIALASRSNRAAVNQAIREHVLGEPQPVVQQSASTESAASTEPPTLVTSV
ncbi:MAG: hypothetical protein ACPG8W_00215 [Candidatus Promineifilaceae bacterium]